MNVEVLCYIYISRTHPCFVPTIELCTHILATSETNITHGKYSRKCGVLVRKVPRIVVNAHYIIIQRHI